MDGTVAGAIIGFAGSGVVAIVGFLATARSAGRSASASTENTRLMLVEEHTKRLWAKRSELYVEILAYLNHRQMGREHALKEYRFTPEWEDAINAALDSYQKPEWFEFEARVRAFASDAVLTAFLEAEQANNAVNTAHRKYLAATEANGAVEALILAGVSNVSPDAAPAVAAAQVVRDAVRDGAQADEVVIQRIRDELVARPAVDRPTES